MDVEGRRLGWPGGCERLRLPVTLRLPEYQGAQTAPVGQAGTRCRKLIRSKRSCAHLGCKCSRRSCHVPGHPVLRARRSAPSWGRLPSRGEAAGRRRRRWGGREKATLEAAGSAVDQVTPNSWLRCCGLPGSGGSLGLVGPSALLQPGVAGAGTGRRPPGQASERAAWPHSPGVDSGYGLGVRSGPRAGHSLGLAFSLYSAASDTVPRVNTTGPEEAPRLATVASDCPSVTQAEPG